MGIYTELLDSIDNATTTYIADSSARIISFIYPDIFSSLLVIWLALWAIMMWFGKSEGTIEDGIIRTIKVSVIMTLALTSSIYNTVVVNFLVNFPMDIMNVASGTTSLSLGGVLDKIGDKFHIIYQETTKKLYAPQVGQWISAIIVYGFGIAIGIILAFLIILAKIMLAVLLAIGPIAITMILFETTKRFFESWLGMVINNALIIVIGSMTGLMIIGIVESVLGIGGAGYPTVNPISQVKTIIVSAIGLLVLKQVPSIASSLGGGIALATAGAISRAAKGALGGRTGAHAMRSVRKSTGEKIKEKSQYLRDKTKSAYRNKFPKNRISK